jgi:hypothetical protein
MIGDLNDLPYLTATPLNPRYMKAYGRPDHSFTSFFGEVVSRQAPN